MSFSAWLTSLSMTISAAAAKSLQLCPTLCDPIDGSPPGSPVSGIFQARVLEWGAIAFSNASKWKVKVKSLSRIRLLATPWTAAYQAPPSMGFSRQEYWSGVPLSSLLKYEGLLFWAVHRTVQYSAERKHWDTYNFFCYSFQFSVLEYFHCICIIMNI